VLRCLALAALAALVLAGCGVRNSKPFTADGTAPCLKDNGFKAVTSSFVRVGFVAGTAENGGLRATSRSGNDVTIAFTADEQSVTATERAFRHHAPASIRPHMSDIMSAQRNAVVVWTTTPASEEMDALTRCLKP
jgi:hypothetical protein